MHSVVISASVVMAVLVAAILCVAIFFAHAVSEGITSPVNQLIDVVRALNRLDFSRQVHMCIRDYCCVSPSLSLLYVCIIITEF